MSKSPWRETVAKVPHREPTIMAYFGPVKEPGRNDPCPCGSKLPYRNCHSDIWNASTDHLLSAAHVQYHRAWKKNSAHYSAKGFYEHLAMEVSEYPRRRILDIGLGTGRGFLELVRKVPAQEDSVFVAIEENLACLNSANEFLQNNGQQTNVIKRLASKVVGERSYSIEHSAEDIRLIAGRLNIIHADFVLDMGLDEMSRGIGGWDAITLWFSGVHKARQHCQQIEQTGAASDADFRMQVEEGALRLAADHLAENGILHIAVRAGSSSIADAEKLMRAHWAGAAAKHGLNIDRVTAMPGSEPHAASAIAVGNQALGAQDVSRFNVALTLRRQK